MNLQELTGETSEAIFVNPHIILIPKKVKRNLTKYVSKTLLKQIDSDVNVAIEKCLLLISNLSPTIYNDTTDEWKALKSTTLRDQVQCGSNIPNVYKRVLEALKIGTKNEGPIIEVLTDDNGFEVYTKGKVSKRYRITDKYRKGLDEYHLQTEELRKGRLKSFYKAMAKATSNAIGRNLFNFYAEVELPTEKELLNEAKRLIKAKYTTNKGKVLTKLNKHKKDYWSDASNRSFVEDNIKMFNCLTGRGLMIPVIGGDLSGGRVVDSFTLMPSWIRKMVKVNGKSIVEADYSALHHNLAQNIYGNALNHISHNMVADYLGITRQEAKVEHLSFFNKRIEGMKKSPLFKYYQDNEPQMLNNILEDKAKWYKHTTVKMFKLEVEVMTEVVERLNEQGVFVMYVYDALYTTDEHIELVRETMNEVTAEKGIYTSVGEDSPTESLKIVEVIEEVSPVESIRVIGGRVNLYEVVPMVEDGPTQTELFRKLRGALGNTNVLEFELELMLKRHFPDKYQKYSEIVKI